MHLLIDIFSQE